MSLLPTPRQFAVDGNGAPLAGAKLYFFEAGTSTPSPVYSDAALTTAHTQPVTSDAAGIWPAIYLSPADYKVQLVDADGVTVWTQDPVAGLLAATGDGSSVTVTPEGENLVASTNAARAGRHLTIQDFGAVGDGIADDAAALLKAAMSGKHVFFPPGDYRTTQPIIIGDGSVSARSTITGTRFVGASGGVGAGEFGAPRQSVRIVYDGPQDNTAAVIKLAGPIHSCGVERMVLDANGKAGKALDIVHAYCCTFRSLFLTNYRVKGLHLRVQPFASLSAMLALGVTQGAMDNLFDQVLASTPALNTADGAHLEGYQTGNIGCSRNTFVSCKFAIGAASGASPRPAGMRVTFADNNTVLRGYTFYSDGDSSHQGNSLYGTGVFFEQGTGAYTSFPHDNGFYDCAIVGGVGGKGDGGNIFWGYAVSDGQPVPDDTACTWLTHTGLLGGVRAIYLKDGSAGSPGYTFSADQNTGLFRAGADAIGFTAGGVERMRLSASGGLSMNTALDMNGQSIVNALYLEIERSGVNNPILSITNADAPIDQKRWNVDVDDAGSLRIQTRNDADSASADVIAITRSGYSTAAVQINASTTISAPGSPSLRVYDSVAAANAKDWRLMNAGGTLQLNTWTDNGLFGANAIEISRSGTTVTEIALQASAIRFGVFTASGDAAVNGYITIKDASGNTRKLATIA